MKKNIKNILTITIFIIILTLSFLMVKKPNKHLENLKSKSIILLNKVKYQKNYILEEDVNYKICINENSKYYYYIYNKNYENVKEKFTEANTLNINKISKNTLEIKEGYGTGIVEKTYYNIEENKFSETFTYSIANTETLIAYFKENNLIIQNLFDKNIYYKEYINNNIDAKYLIEGKIIDSYFTNNNKELIINYYKNNKNNIEKIEL